MNEIVPTTPEHSFEFLRKWGIEREGDGEFHQLGGIAVDGQGRVYGSDTGNDRIQVFRQAAVNGPTDR